MSVGRRRANRARRATVARKRMVATTPATTSLRRLLLSETPRHESWSLSATGSSTQEWDSTIRTRGMYLVHSQPPRTRQAHLERATAAGWTGRERRWCSPRVRERRRAFFPPILPPAALAAQARFDPPRATDLAHSHAHVRERRQALGRERRLQQPPHRRVGRAGATYTGVNTPSISPSEETDRRLMKMSRLVNLS